MDEAFKRIKKAFLMTFDSVVQWRQTIIRNWAERVSLANSFIMLCDSPEEAVAFAQKCGAFDHRYAVGSRNTTIKDLYDMFRESFPSAEVSLEESRFSRNDTVQRIDGKLLSNSFIWNLHQFFRPKTYLDYSKIKDVVEIGGGYGGLCRLWLGMTDARYTIIDLPTSIFFQKCFLLLNGLLDDKRVRFVPIYDPIPVGHDLGIACACLGEINNSFAEGLWKNVLMRCDSVYSLNYFGNDNPPNLGSSDFTPITDGFDVLHREENPRIPKIDTDGNWLELVMTKHPN